MPFLQMLCDITVSLSCTFALWFLIWWHFIFCSIWCSGLLAFCFLLFLSFTIFAFLLSIIICKCNDHEVSICNHIAGQATLRAPPLVISSWAAVSTHQNLTATLLVTEPPKSPSVCFTFPSLWMPASLRIWAATGPAPRAYT